MFAVAIWDAPRRRLVLARDRFGIKPLYYRVDDVSLSFASELDALPQGELDLDALEAFLAFNSIPAPLSIFREIRKLPAGHVLDVGGRARSRSSATRGRARCRRGTTPTRPSSSRSAARGCATRCARISSPTCRSACCSRAASTRARSRRSPRRRAPSRCARSRSGSRRRRSTSSPARARSRSGTARAIASSCCGPTRRCSCRRSPRRSTSRSPTRRRCRRTSSRKLAAEDVKVALSGEGGDELFGGYYTYVADLLAERVGPLATLARPARRAAAGLDAQGELRLQGEAVRARRAPAAARAAPRLEGDLLRRRAGRADRAAARVGSGLAAARALRRDRGARAADAAPGRRPRRLPRRRPAREDRPRVDGVVARDARAVHGHRRRRVRVLAAGAAQGARLLEEAAAAEGGRAAAAGRGRARPQARLLDPGGGVAARRARAVRARDALGRDAAAAGLPPSPRRSRACSTTTSRAARTCRASSGGCSRSRSGTSATSRASRRDAGLAAGSSPDDAARSSEVEASRLAVGRARPCASS